MLVISLKVPKNLESGKTMTNQKRQQQADKTALNFDLFQNELKAHGFEDPVKAYGELGKSLRKYGFEKRQQSSWISEEPIELTDVYTTLNKIMSIHPWFSDCVNKITATAESAILDLNPLIHDKMSEKEFLDFENSKGVEKEVRAIHFDLGIKQIDANYEYRSKPYSEINKAMYELGFHRQQGSGYISNTDLTPDEFIYTIQKLKEKVPKLEKVVKHIDATYLKDVWDMKPFVSGNLKGTLENKEFNYINENSKAISESFTSKKDLTEKQLLLLNQKVRYGQASPDVLIGNTFEFKNEIYKITDLKLIEGETKDVATLQRLSDGSVFQDNDFASTNPFKLDLKQKDNSKKVQKIKNKAEKIKSK